MAKRKNNARQSSESRTAWGKKEKHLNITLSLEGWRLAKERADELGISISEVVERWGRRFDVNFDDSHPIPAELDSRADMVKSMPAIELCNALGEKIESQEEELASRKRREEIYEKLVNGLLEEKLSNADRAKYAGLLDLDESKAEQLMQLGKSTKGGKKTNGV